MQMSLRVQSFILKIRPYFQILSSKRIAGSSSERYRLLISDGMYSNSYAMLATQLNGMVAEKQLDDYCVVKVKRLQCNTMQMIIRLFRDHSESLIYEKRDFIRFR